MRLFLHDDKKIQINLNSEIKKMQIYKNTYNITTTNKLLLLILLKK